MTTISAKVVADSIGIEAPRLTTIEARYPRFIHSELMTHRVFSRNARSSRAVPVERMIKEIYDDPVIPLHWGKAQKGMQAYEECDNSVQFRNDVVPREAAWLRARDNAAQAAKQFHHAGYHKQIVNRLLEPFMHIDVLITATEWSNFLALRDHEMAEPHIQMLAKAIKEAMAASTPKVIKRGQWHLPYVTEEEMHSLAWQDLHLHELTGLPLPGIEMEIAKRVSVARCARISYAPFDGDGSIEKEIQRHDDLVGAVPMHASPAEHQATPDDRMLKLNDDIWWANQHLHGNLRGWIQYRKTLPGENQ